MHRTNGLTLDKLLTFNYNFWWFYLKMKDGKNVLLNFQTWEILVIFKRIWLMKTRKFNFKRDSHSHVRKTWMIIYGSSLFLYDPKWKHWVEKDFLSTVIKRFNNEYSSYPPSTCASLFACVGNVFPSVQTKTFAFLDKKIYLKSKLHLDEEKPQFPISN